MDKTRLHFRLVVFVLAGFFPLIAYPQEDSAWIAKGCPPDADMNALMSLDQAVSKAIMSALRAGDYRSAFRYAVDFQNCLKSLGEVVSLMFSGRLEVLDRVICGAPLGVFEVEQKIDPDLGHLAVSMCPKPADTPPQSKEEWDQWRDEVVRYLVLQASVNDLAFVRREALGFIDREALRRLVEQSKVEKSQKPEQPEEREQEGKGAAPPAQQKPPSDSEKSEIVPQALIIAVTASAALGDFSDIVQLFPDKDSLCTFELLRLWFLLHASTIAQKQPPSALSLAMKRIATSVPLSDIVKTVKKASEAYGPKCVLVSATASLALASLGGEGLDKEVQEGRVQEISFLVSNAEIPVLLGSPASREKVFLALAGEKDGEEKALALCQAGQSAMEDKRYKDALAHFESALLVKKDALCGLSGKVLALLGLKQAVGDAITSYLQAKPSADDVQALLRSCEDDQKLTLLAQAVFKANSKVQDENATRALIALVDAKPGTKPADAVVGVVDRLGSGFSKDEKAIANLIAFRHYALMKRNDKARIALSRAYSGGEEPSDNLKQVSLNLAMFLLHNRHFEPLKDFLGVAVPKKVFANVALAQIAKDLALLGERGMAKGLIARVEKEGLEGKDLVLAVAEAYSHLDMGEKALKVFEKIGPEATWDNKVYFVKGRIEMGLRKYREAHAALTKAYQLGNNDLDAIYFRGLTRLLMGDAEGAEQDFSKCVEMGAKSAEVLGGLAYSYFDNQKYEEAERTFREAIALDEKGADNHIGLALSLFRLNRLEDAKKAFERACTYEKAMKAGYKEAEKRGFVYSDIEKKAWDEMLEAFRKMKK